MMHGRNRRAPFWELPRPPLPDRQRSPVHGATLPFWRGRCVTALCGIHADPVARAVRLVRITEPNARPAGELSGSDRATRRPTEELRDGPMVQVARRSSSQRLNSCAQVAILGRSNDSASEPGGWLSGSDRPLRWPTGVCSAGASALHGRGPPHHPLTGMEGRPSKPMYLLRPPRISPCPPAAGRQPQAVRWGFF
jgi:hypothetical protein